MADNGAGPAKTTGPKWETDAKDSIRTGLRRFSKPLADLVARDANEGDTRLVVTDFLCEALGFDKFADLTTEFQVRGEFVDYGLRIDKQLVAFIEVKRAAQQLNARHLRQVETYAVKEGLEWVLLTNGHVWQAYHVSSGTGQQTATSLDFEVDILGDESTAAKIGKLFQLHRSALKHSTISELWKHRSATSPAALAKTLLSDAMLDALRKETRRESGYNAELADLATVLRSGVIRPELL